MDKHPELYEAIKKRVQGEGTTLNDFAIQAFSQALGWEKKEDNPPPAPVWRTQLEEVLVERLAPMQRRLEEVERHLGESRA
jgi:hypothetical protein